MCGGSFSWCHKEFKKCSTAFLGGGSHLIPSGKLPRDVVEYLQKANDSKGAFSMGAYISTFPTGFAGLIPAALQKLLPWGPGGAALRPEAGGRGRRPGDELPPAPAVRHLGQREEGRRLPAGGGPRLIKGTSAPPGLGPLCRAGWGFPPAAGEWSRRSSPKWR